MKKVLLTLFVLMLAVSLVGCGSTYGKIKSAFENEGYVEQEIEEGNEYKEMQDELKEAGTEFTVHHLKKDAIIDKDVIILEFKNVDGIKELLEGENDIADTMEYLLDLSDTTYEDIYDGLEEAGFVNGNCMFIVADIMALEDISIFKEAK